MTGTMMLFGGCSNNSYDHSLNNPQAESTVEAGEGLNGPIGRAFEELENNGHNVDASATYTSHRATGELKSSTGVDYVEIGTHVLAKVDQDGDALITISDNQGQHLLSVEATG